MTKKVDHRVRPARLVTSVILTYRGKILLVQEGKGKAFGKWNQPAGHIEPNEDPLLCAKRETLEESGYHVRLTRFLGVIYSVEDAKKKKEPSVNLCFLATPMLSKKRQRLASDILDARWFSLAEIQKMKKEEFRGRATLLRLTWWKKKFRGLPLAAVHQFFE